MGIFKKFANLITGKDQVDKVLDTGVKVVDSTIDGIDALFFTDEEKAVMKIETYNNITGHVMDMVKSANNESSVRSITRRIIAVTLIITFDLCFIAAIVFGLLGQENLVIRIIETLKAFSFDTIIMGVLIFYFGYYGIKEIKK